MIEKIKNYFQNKYILKTFVSSSYDINQTDLDFQTILNKYDVKTKFNDKILVYSILSVACELKSGGKEEILYSVLNLYLDTLNESFDYSNKSQYLQIRKLKFEMKFAETKKEKIIKSFFLEESLDFSPSGFSKDNFDFASACVQDLIDNNVKYKNSYCKSYKTLSYPKTSIELAFNYLLDSAKFDENSPVYGNKDYINSLNEIHAAMLITYFNTDFREIPTDRFEQVKFSSKNRIDIGRNQFEITELINWRNKEQWLYFSNAMGIETELGKLCLEKSKLA